MAKRKRAKKNPRPKDLLESFVESKAAVVLILINATVFIFLKYVLQNPLPDSLILYPSQLSQGYLWTLVTSGFIHQNGTHLLLNMLGIFVFGRVVEREMGTTKTFFIYFGALMVSMVVSTLIYAFVFHKNIAIIGASGAVMGLIAAATLWSPLSITYEMILPLPVMMKGWMFFYADLKGFLGGEGDGVSHLAHLCGFLSLAFLVYFMSPKERQKMHWGLLINIISFIAFLALRRRLLLI